MLLILFSDSALGRLDFASLSQQALMEMLVESLDEKKRFQDSNGHYLDVTEWPHVEFDSSGSVAKIIWAYDHSRYLPPGKHISIEFLPETVTELFIQNNRLIGPIELRKLPRTMRVIDLSDNCFTGPLKFSDLPPTMEAFYAERNSFVGSIDLSSLPINLQDFLISENGFDGGVSLDHLPDRLEMFDLGSALLAADFDFSKIPVHMLEFWVSLTQLSPRIRILSDIHPKIISIKFWNNEPSSVVDIRTLPKTLVQLWIGGNTIEHPIESMEWPAAMTLIALPRNGISGSVSWEGLPRELNSLDMSNNSLSGSIIVEELPQTLKTLIVCQNRFFGSFQLHKLPPILEKLNISSNHLNGSLDFSGLPPTLSHLILSKNEFSGSIDMVTVDFPFIELRLNNNRFSGRFLISEDVRDTETFEFSGNEDLDDHWVVSQE